MKITDEQKDRLVNLVQWELNENGCYYDEGFNGEKLVIDNEICTDIVNSILKELGIEIDYVSGGKGPED